MASVFSPRSAWRRASTVAPRFAISRAYWKIWGRPVPVVAGRSSRPRLLTAGGPRLPVPAALALRSWTPSSTPTTRKVRRLGDILNATQDIA
jgi:hypothetical protein